MPQDLDGSSKPSAEASVSLETLLKSSPELVLFLNTQNAEYEKLKKAHHLLIRRLKDSQATINTLNSIIEHGSTCQDLQNACCSGARDPSGLARGRWLQTDLHKRVSYPHVDGRGPPRTRANIEASHLGHHTDHTAHQHELCSGISDHKQESSFEISGALSHSNPTSAVDKGHLMDSKSELRVGTLSVLGLQETSSKGKRALEPDEVVQHSTKQRRSEQQLASDEPKSALERGVSMLGYTTTCQDTIRCSAAAHQEAKDARCGVIMFQEYREETGNQMLPEVAFFPPNAHFSNEESRTSADSYDRAKPRVPEEGLGRHEQACQPNARRQSYRIAEHGGAKVCARISYRREGKVERSRTPPGYWMTDMPSTQEERARST